MLGIDYGERRIGLALTDPTGTIASPRETLTYRKGRRPPLGAIARIAREHDVGRVVVGLPLEPSGEESERCEVVRRVGRELHVRLAVPVEFIDERMSSAQAERVVRGELGLPRSRREEKGRVDSIAAALILRRWLDREGGER